MKTTWSAWRYLWKSEDIRRMLLVTIALLVIYRLAANVPVPGIDFQRLAEIRKSLAATGGNFFDFLDLLSGGTVSRFSLLSMGVYPYITAQIILQLLIPIIPALQRKMEDNPTEGRKWQEKWTYYLAVPMAALSAIGQINIFNSVARQANIGAVLDFGFTPDKILPSMTALLSMIAGTMFAIWLGELISEYGIRGQGLSLIIFAGIVARIPTNLSAMLTDEQNRWWMLALMIVVIVSTIFAICFCSARPPQCAGDVSRASCGQPHVNAGEGLAAVDGQYVGHDTAHFCRCHPAIPDNFGLVFSRQFKHWCSPICSGCTKHVWRQFRYLLDFVLLHGSDFYLLLY